MFVIFLLILAMIISFILAKNLREKEVKYINYEYYEEYLIEYRQVFKYRKVSDFVVTPVYPSNPEDPIEVKFTETNVQYNKTFSCSFYKEEERKAHEEYLIKKYGKPDYISPVEISSKHLINKVGYAWSRLGKENIETTFRSMGYPTELIFCREGF